MIVVPLRHLVIMRIGGPRCVGLAANLLACFRHLALPPDGERRGATPKLLRYSSPTGKRKGRTPSLCQCLSGVGRARQAAHAYPRPSNRATPTSPPSRPAPDRPIRLDHAWSTSRPPISARSSASTTATPSRLPRRRLYGAQPEQSQPALPRPARTPSFQEKRAGILMLWMTPDGLVHRGPADRGSSCRHDAVSSASVSSVS